MYIIHGNLSSLGELEFRVASGDYAREWGMGTVRAHTAYARPEETVSSVSYKRNFDGKGKMTSSALHFRKITWFTLKQVLKRGICGGKEHDLEVIEMTAELFRLEIMRTWTYDSISDNEKMIDLRNIGKVESIVIGPNFVLGNKANADLF